MQREQGKTSRHVKNQRNKTPPKDHTSLSVTGPKDMEINDLPSREFKIAVLRKLHEPEDDRKTIQQNQEHNTWTESEV